MRLQIRLFPLTAAAIVASSACAGADRPEVISTPIRNTSLALERVPGLFNVSPDTLLWVTEDADLVIDADEIARNHPDVLAGQGVNFATQAITSGGMVSDDESVVAVPVRTSDGVTGIALVREDGYKMALHLIRGPDVSIGSIKFMPKFGLTLVSLGGEDGSKVVAINNYGMQQFQLPVSNFTGNMKYSASELRYMVIDRRPLEQEIELVSFTDPADTVLLRGDDSSQEARGLYHALVETITDWK